MHKCKNAKGTTDPAIDWPWVLKTSIHNLYINKGININNMELNIKSIISSKSASRVA